MKKWVIGEESSLSIRIPCGLELSPEVEADILLAYQEAARIPEAQGEGVSGSEVSGIGRITLRDDNSFFVSRIIIPDQTCTRAGTIFAGEEMDKILEQLDQEGEDTDEYCFWWHSHVGGFAQFSNTDDAMINRRLSALLTSEFIRLPEGTEEALSGPFVSLVGNIHKEMTARCDFMLHHKGTRTQITFSLPLVRHLGEMTPEETAKIGRDRFPNIKELVSQRVRYQVLSAEEADASRRRGLAR